jgi:hypothetical protein
VVKEAAGRHHVIPDSSPGDQVIGKAEKSGSVVRMMHSKQTGTQKAG